MLNKNFSFGEKVVILYFSVFYFLTITINLSFDMRINNTLGGNPDYVKALSFSFLYLSLYLIYRKIFKMKKKHIKINMKFIFSKKIIYFFLIIYLFIAIQFNINFEANFRHQQAYAASGFIPIILFSLLSYHLIIILLSASNNNRIKLPFTYYIVFAIGTFISLNSSSDAFYIVISLYTAFLTQEKGNYLKFISSIIKRFDKQIFFVTLVTMVIAGLYNKMGIDNLHVFFNENTNVFLTFIDLVFNRLSYHAYALAHHVNNISDSFSNGITAYEITLFQSARRALILLGYTLDGDYLQTISRLNFIILNPKSNILAGSSPGILGSIFFIPGSIFATPLHIIVLSHFTHLLDDIMGKKEKYGMLYYFFGVIILQAVFASLMDSLNPFSLGFITYFLILFAASFSREQDKKRYKLING